MIQTKLQVEDRQEVHQPLEEIDRKCTLPCGGIPIETNREKSTELRDRDEDDRPHGDDRQNHHSHQDAAMNARRHEGHKREARRWRQARTEWDRLPHNTEKVEPQ